MIPYLCSVFPGPYMLMQVIIPRNFQETSFENTAQAVDVSIFGTINGSARCRHLNFKYCACFEQGIP